MLLRRRLVYFFLVLTLLPFISSEIVVGIPTDNFIGVVIQSTPTVVSNNSEAVNSSDFWDALDTPSDISGSEFWYNQTEAVKDTWVNESGDTMTGDLFINSSGTNSVLKIANAITRIRLSEDDQSVSNKNWECGANSNRFTCYVAYDNWNAGEGWLQVERTGVVIDQVEISNGDLIVEGDDFQVGLTADFFVDNSGGTVQVRQGNALRIYNPADNGYTTIQNDGTNIKANWDWNFTGNNFYAKNVTANQYFGDGSQLTGLKTVDNLNVTTRLHSKNENIFGSSIPHASYDGFNVNHPTKGAFYLTSDDGTGTLIQSAKTDGSAFADIEFKAKDFLFTPSGGGKLGSSTGFKVTNTANDFYLGTAWGESHSIYSATDNLQLAVSGGDIIFNIGNSASDEMTISESDIQISGDFSVGTTDLFVDDSQDEVYINHNAMRNGRYTTGNMHIYDNDGFAGLRINEDTGGNASIKLIEWGESLNEYGGFIEHRGIGNKMVIGGYSNGVKTDVVEFSQTGGDLTFSSDGGGMWFSPVSDQWNAVKSYDAEFEGHFGDRYPLIFQTVESGGFNFNNRNGKDLFAINADTSNTTSAIWMGNDGQKTYWGADDDVSIHYDGTNMVLTGNVNISTGYTGTCVNATYTMGIVTGCND